MAAIGIRARSSLAPVMLSGLVAAMVLLAMPAGFIETIVASSGLSETWAAAGPPLGLKARLLLAAFGALMTIGLIWAAQERDKERRDRAAGVEKMGFALSKLSWLSRRRPPASSRVVRRADAHPDAPARTPIFASRELGNVDIVPRAADSGAPQAEQGAVVFALPRPVLDQATPDQVVDAEFEEIVEPTPVHRPLTIAELTARLETGLAHRSRAISRDAAPSVLADLPVQPAVPVRDRVEADVDEALRNALSALRALTERPR